MRRLVVATLAVAGLLALALGWWSTVTDAPDAGGDAAVAVRTAAVREPAEAGPTLTATVEAGLTVPVTAPRQAAVGEVAVAAGDRVAPGDVLVRFEQTTEQAAVMSAEAELDQARAELATQNVEAPVAGRVASVRVARGDLVTAGGQLVELRREDASAVRFEVPPEARAALAVDDRVEIVADGDVRAARVVATHTPPGDVAAGRQVVAEPADAAGLPAPGATVEVRLPAGETTWVTVPRAALIDDARGRRVFRVDRGVAWSLPVETAPEAEAGAESATDERVAVRGALQPGERVATTELDRLTDGAPVAVLDAER